MDGLLDRYAGLALWLQSLIALAGLVVVALAVNWLIKRVLLRAAALYLDRRSDTADRAVARLATVIPLLVVSRGIDLVPNLPPELVTVTVNVVRALIVLSVAMAISGALDYANELYARRPEARSRPIKGYIQVVKIARYCGAAILMIAVLIEQSPLLLLSGLGAMAAVLLLVFKDTILSLVASVQMTSNDMLRVGDWIEMPSMDADGDVIDVDDLQLTPAPPTMAPTSTDDADGLRGELEELERQRILEALQATRFNKTKAAERLGMSFRQLRYRTKKLGID